MNGPRVSVLLASRNGADTLPQALESLAAQRYPNVEIIAVDDGSTDGTGTILERFAAAHAHVVVLRGSGLGLATALNLAALNSTTGELFARHDDDDRSHPDRFARQVEFLERNPAIAIVGTAARRIGPAGEPLGDYPVPSDPAAIRRALRRGPPFVHGSVMMRAGAFRTVGGYRAAFLASQDYDLWLRFPPDTGFANLPEPLYDWRCHPRGTFMRDRPSQLRFNALARVFARERAEFGVDSYDAFKRARDLETFVGAYRLGDRLALLLGELHARDGLLPQARHWFRRALASRRTAAAAAAWWGATFAVALTPRARRHARRGAP